MSIYTITKKKIEELLIVEITQKNFDFQDFVLLYFSGNKIQFEKVQQIVNEYRKKKCVCIIGSCQKSITKDDFSEVQNLFDLYFENMTENQFKSLVEACYGTKSGIVHGDPFDWFSLKSEKDNIVYILSGEGKSLEEATDVVIDEFKYFHRIDEEKKINNLICSIQCLESDEFLISDIKSTLTKMEEALWKKSELQNLFCFWFQNIDLKSKFKIVCIFSVCSLYDEISK